MDMISILNGLKNKVLDVKNYELLKHTYELQEENIKQLKTSNETIKDNNKLLQEKVDLLEKENRELNKSLPKIQDRNESEVLSEVELAILELYRERSAEPLYKESQIIPALSSNFTRIQIEAEIDKLEEVKMLEWSHRKSDRGRSSWLEARNKLRVNVQSHEDDIPYALTKEGRKKLVGNI